ncbi:UDP-3-O-(3-hydroxymyristoyl)glucosamine N-acyltransferase [Oleiharenicola lentus]|uniref:UDP-3-O-(3-hydroxymyristoyl)glucosamine N-acyltransferase n=1 Tax=Oleiharenicola lentus TaxID=2508720 RepID=UPI003F68052A
MTTFTAAEIAAHLKGTVIGDGSVLLTGFTCADRARAGDLTFAEKDTYFAAAEASAAAAILVAGDFPSATKTLIRVPNARIAAAKVLPLFFPFVQPVACLHGSSSIADSAKIDPTAHIGPHCVIGENVVIGARTVLTGGNHLAENCQLGDDVCLKPNVVLYARTQLGHRVTIHAGTVIGSDGYGYVFDQGRHLKMNQVGQVIIHDDVEIGANTAIDRGALGPTIIGAGTKIDNLVHVAHNVVMGKHCLVMGQVGFAGSTELKDYCVIASQSGIAGHLKLGPQATVGAKSGVMRDVAPKETVLGMPAMPDKQAKRQWIAVQKLPELMMRMRELEKQLAEIRAAALVAPAAKS